jgi:hypothetical protein
MHLGSVNVSRLRPIGRRVRATRACRNACFRAMRDPAGPPRHESGFLMTARYLANRLRKKNEY